MEDVVEVKLSSDEGPRGDLLVVGVLEGGDLPVEGLPEALRSVCRRLAGRPGWQGKEGQRVEAESGSAEVPQVALRGLGKEGRLHLGKLQKWLFDTVEEARRGGARSLALALPEHALTTGNAALGHVSRQLALSQYRFDRYREQEEERRDVESVELVAASRDRSTEEAIAQGSEVARAVVTARNLANTPPNIATPQWVAEQAEELAAAHGLEIEVLSAEDLERKGMRAILAVGGGSQNPPCLARLRWAGGEGPRIALVGKGITFDSGGISIKPAKDMDEMKYDKCGACTVLATMQAVARLGIPAQVSAYLPLAENLLDGRAYRPGDIVRCYNGKTVEVLNTDAEGRMILADALAWAAEQRPEHLVELSTLTGSCVVALGGTGAGLFSPDDELASSLLQRAEEAGERLWRLPLWPEHREALQGVHGDLKNIGGRYGGASIAGAFLGDFVGDVTSWGHLDIAGPAYVGSDGNGPRGATGYGVALLSRWLQSLGQEG
jgi:leucyl aminopeptidase